MNDEITITIKGKENAIELAEWIKCSVFETIRNDDEVDNFGWIIFWANIVQQLENACE